MRTEDRVFWLDFLRESSGQVGGVLCQRHGDSMVVPRGWTLDDQRDPELHLFRPPAESQAPKPANVRRRRAPAGDDTEQLELGDLRARAAEADAAAERGAPTDHVETDPVDFVDPDDQWTPSFDDGDDLDGLLSATSPLLSRAFRGTDRSS
jgi:hypothetical protein